ncbi:TetR/AcrR family transcriptional regulator [Sphingomonas colocasiae]|uniref:TetR/AcrR family transcriptional regulator n=1 Tax=Sphingomonas colocasiae TaxID=1848973 RepID=A0ABS7PQA0_9SPHN|nr:TetR/AcrR family transcriptional regulator [Sphingomonas colocasiae]MBY8823510.1 TetR/AcrR family transcriptional regulator [Sphingomonas colocasiae]
MILSAAAQMFRERGYAAASIDAIAMASGISGPGIYRYFKRKTELLVALLEAAVADANEALKTMMASIEDGDAVAAMADLMADHALREGTVIGLLQGTIHEMDETDQARLEEIRRGLVLRWATQLCRARPELTLQQAKVHVEAALTLLGHLARRMPDPGEQSRYRQIVRAVLLA